MYQVGYLPGIKIFCRRSLLPSWSGYLSAPLFMTQIAPFRGTAQKMCLTSPLTFLSVEILKNLVYAAPTENTQIRHQRIFYACQIIRNGLVIFERVGNSAITRSTCT
jgi:hypothetical protein